MNNIPRQQMLDELASDVREIVLQAEKLRRLSTAQLNLPREDGGWSIAQVLVHLNIYSAYYLPAIARYSTSHAPASETIFRSGWLGNYFTKLMKPGVDGRPKSKMKSPANARPSESHYTPDVLDRFIEDQHALLDLLQDVRRANLQARVPISLSKWIRLKLGDVLRFVVAHEQRHMAQIMALPASKE